MTESIYTFLYEGLSMKAVGIGLGLVLLAGHLFALLRPAPAKDFLKRFPRNRTAGITLLVLAALWSYVLMSEIDMGEFYGLRGKILLAIPIATVLVIFFAEDFLAVRAFGAVVLLASSPILHSAFLQPQVTRLLIPVLAYAWIVGALFWVGMPYLMRDAITWLTAEDSRWRRACFAGIGYGAALLLAAVTTY